MKELNSYDCYCIQHAMICFRVKLVRDFPDQRNVSCRDLHYWCWQKKLVKLCVVYSLICLMCCLYITNNRIKHCLRNVYSSKNLPKVVTMWSFERSLKILYMNRHWRICILYNVVEYRILVVLCLTSRLILMSRPWRTDL